MEIQSTEKDEKIVEEEIITDEKLYFAKIKKRAWKQIRGGLTATPLSIWYSHFAVSGTGKAGHLPGSLYHDTICVDKAGSDSETPRHIGKKKLAADMAEDGSTVWEITDEARKLGTSYIGRS